jgi:ArsR family transcriptional regulator, arsenate/arsenite/antimonite-responsive transcriptional repressor
MKEYADVMKAMSDETRLRILCLLQGRELCVCDICEALGIHQAKASRHLAVLRAAGLVLDERLAQWMHYSVAEGWWSPMVCRLSQDFLSNTDQGKSDLESLDTWMERKDRSC